MKFKIVLFIIAVLLLSGCRSLGNWYGTNPEPITRFEIDINSGFQAERVKFNGMIYDLVIIDPLKIKLQIAIENNEGVKISYLENDFGKENILFITNAGMFTKEYKALGYLSYKEKQISAINLGESDYGNFYLKPNGIFYINNNIGNILESERFNKIILEKNIIPYLATQSGPLLLNEGNIHPAFNKGSKNRYIRNGVGIINNRNLIVFAISNRPVNFYDFSVFFRDFLNSNNALYLDGNISIMYIPELNRKQYRGTLGPVIYALTE